MSDEDGDTTVDTEELTRQIEESMREVEVEVRQAQRQMQQVRVMLPERRYVAQVAGGGATVRTSTLNGSITLLAAGTREADARPLVSGRRSMVVTVPRVEVHAPNVQVHMVAPRAPLPPGGLRVEPPTAPEAEEEGEDIVRGDIAGDLLSTSNGGYHVGHVSGKVKILTHSGEIHIASAGNGAEIKTYGGDVHIGSVKGDLKARTLAGDVRAGVVAGSATVDTSGGDIRIDRISGSAVARTEGGDIVFLVSGGPVEAETGGGEIRIGVLSQVPKGGVTIKNAGGDVLLTLPGDFHGDVDCLVEGPADPEEVLIRSEFPGLTITRGPDAQRAVGALNGGGPRVLVRTSSGSIRLRARAGRRLLAAERLPPPFIRDSSAGEIECRSAKAGRRSAHEGGEDDTPTQHDSQALRGGTHRGARGGAGAGRQVEDGEGGSEQRHAGRARGPSRHRRGDRSEDHRRASVLQGFGPLEGRGLPVADRPDLEAREGRQAGEDRDRLEVFLVDRGDQDQFRFEEVEEQLEEHVLDVERILEFRELGLGHREGHKVRLGAHGPGGPQHGLGEGSRSASRRRAGHRQEDRLGPPLLERGRSLEGRRLRKHHLEDLAARHGQWRRIEDDDFGLGDEHAVVGRIRSGLDLLERVLLVRAGIGAVRLGSLPGPAVEGDGLGEHRDEGVPLRRGSLVRQDEGRQVHDREGRDRGRLPRLEAEDRRQLIRRRSQFRGAEDSAPLSFF